VDLSGVSHWERKLDGNSHFGNMVWPESVVYVREASGNARCALAFEVSWSGWGRVESWSEVMVKGSRTSLVG